MSKLKGLGQGLDALLGVIPSNECSIQKLPIKQLRPGKYQPRRHYDTDNLTTLVDSIRQHGIIQAIVVRPILIDCYEIIAGERRWRAAQQAGLEQVPVVVRQVDDQTALALALIENLQREDLNPLDQAYGLQRLVDEFAITHEACAHIVGKSRSAISNTLRLLQLTPAIHPLLASGQLRMGHARALLSLSATQQIDVAEQIKQRDLSVRQVEHLVRQYHRTPSPNKITVEPQVETWQKTLSNRLNTKVVIAKRKQGHGRITIQYNSPEQLQAFVHLLQA